MGAPPTTNAGQSTNTNPAFPVSDDAEGVVKRSPASSLVNQNTKKIVRRRPVNLIDANGKLIDLGKIIILSRFQVNHFTKQAVFRR
jgi:hypothetical protein